MNRIPFFGLSYLILLFICISNPTEAQIDFDKFQAVEGSENFIRSVITGDETKLYSLGYPYTHLVKLKKDEGSYFMEIDTDLPDSEGHFAITRVKEKTFSLKNQADSENVTLCLLEGSEWAKIAQFEGEIAINGVHVLEKKIVFVGEFEAISKDSDVMEFPGFVVFAPENNSFHSFGQNSESLFLDEPINFEFFNGQLFSKGDVLDGNGQVAHLCYLEGDLISGIWKNDYSYPAITNGNNRLLSMGTNNEFLFAHNIEGYLFRKDKTGDWIKSLQNFPMEGPFRKSSLSVCENNLLLFGKAEKEGHLDTDANLIEFPLHLQSYQILTRRDENNQTTGIGKVLNVSYLEGDKLLFTGQDLNVGNMQGGALVYDPNIVSNILEELSFDIQIYPNPCSDYVHFKSKFPVNLTLFTDTGFSIENHLVESQSILHVSTLPNGIYFLLIENAKGKKVKQIVIQH